MEKTPNMLNEIAANNQLLQNNDVMRQMQNFQGTPINKISLPQQSQPQLQQSQLQQSQQPQIQQQPTYYTPSSKQDEIELSDPKPTPKEKLNEISQQVKRSNENIMINSQPIRRKNMMPIIKQPIPQPPLPKPKNNILTNYIVVPIILIIIFIFLVHPKTSSLLEKYLPKMNSNKGYLVRGVVLAILYIIVISIIRFTKKN